MILIDIAVESINASVIQAGVLFVRNCDKDGRPILIFKGKQHQKDSVSHEAAKQLFVYLMENLVSFQQNSLIRLA